MWKTEERRGGEGKLELLLRDSLFQMEKKPKEKGKGRVGEI